MKSVAFLFMHLLVLFAKPLKSSGTKAIIAENLMLKQQLIVLSRAQRKAPNLQTGDRFLLGAFSLLISLRRLLTVGIVIQPATLLIFNRALVKRKYRRLFSNKGRRRPGPKGSSLELINAIVKLKQRDRRYGCPRIAHIITITFGIEINKEIVPRILAKHYKPKSGNTQVRSWLSLLGHSKDSLWSIDLFRCESLILKSYWILVVMDQWSRRIIGFGIHQGPVGGVAACRMFNHVISRTDPPRYLGSDNDPLFRLHRWKANLRIVPRSHTFVERLIGTIRREFLDQVPFWNSQDLERKLGEFKDYHNNHRTHTTLFGHSPGKFGRLANSGCANVIDYGWQQHCRGLLQTPIPA